MDEQAMRQMMHLIVSAICQGLTDEELTALALAAELGTDPTGVAGYDKAKALYTEAGETKMHEETRRAFLSYAHQWLT